MLLHNSAKDGCKEDKLVKCWRGTYKIKEHVGKSVYRIPGFIGDNKIWRNYKIL